LEGIHLGVNQNAADMMGYLRENNRKAEEADHADNLNEAGEEFLHRVRSANLIDYLLSM